MFNEKTRSASIVYPAVLEEKRIPLITPRRIHWEIWVLIIIYILEIPEILLCNYLIGYGYGCMTFHANPSFDYFGIAILFSLTLQAGLFILIAICMTKRIFRNTRNTDELKWKIMDSIINTFFGFAIYGFLFGTASILIEVFSLAM